MEPTTLTIAAFAFVGSCIAQKCADATLDAAWARLAGAFKKWRGTEPTILTVEAAATEGPVNADILNEVETVFGLSPALRRARLVANVIKGSRLLWIDDHPENNIWERELFRAFGAEVTSVESSRSALACLAQRRYDVIVSDIARAGRSDEGTRVLSEITSWATGAPIVFYVGLLRDTAPPLGAFGITNNPNELLHLVLDVLERSRV